MKTNMHRVNYDGTKSINGDWLFDMNNKNCKKYCIFSNQSRNRIYVACGINMDKLNPYYYVYGETDNIEDIPKVILYMHNGEKDEFFNDLDAEEFYNMLYFVKPDEFEELYVE